MCHGRMASPSLSTAAYWVAEYRHGHQQPFDRDGLRNRVTLTFDLLTSGSKKSHSKRLLQSIRVPTIKFGVDSSSRLPGRARTNRQTRLKAVPTPATKPAWLITNQQQQRQHQVDSASQRDRNDYACPSTTTSCSRSILCFSFNFLSSVPINNNNNSNNNNHHHHHRRRRHHHNDDDNDELITTPSAGAREKTSNDGWCLSSSVVVLCNAVGGQTGRPPGA